MKKLRKIFSHSFPHRIWRIVPVYGSDELAIEERDEESSVIRMHRYRSGGEIRTVPVPEMPWWSTLVSSHAGAFLVRSYGAEGSAARHTLASYDHETGRQLWEREETQLLDELPGRIHVSLGGAPVWLDVCTGQKLRPEVVNHGVNQNKGANFPFRYTEESEYFSTVNRFISRQGISPMRHAIDYLEFDHYVLIAGYIRGERELHCDLYVFDLKGNPVLEKRIGENLPGISDNTFFIYGGNLIFVTSRNDFFEYTLV